MKKALVTGHLGFIGRHMTSSLERHGFSVTGVDVKAGHDARDFFRQDCTHYDVVVHAAAVVGGRQVIDGSPLSHAVNFELDAGLFSWAHRNRPGRIMYLSSSAVYPVHLQRRGRQQQLIELHVDLDTPELPDALYGWVKLTGEKLAKIARSDGLKVSVVRPFSGYGEDQDDCYPFPAFIARALHKEDPFTIWGSGSQARDWIHVSDICRAIMAMLLHDVDGPVNLGSGKAVTMLSLAEKVTAAAGYQPQFSVIKGKPMGVYWRVSRNDELMRICPPHVTLEEGIHRAIKMGTSK